MKETTEKVIINFLCDDSNIQELESLRWISKDENYNLFRIVSIHHYSNVIMNKSDKDSIISEINKRISNERVGLNKVIVFKKFYKYVAIVVASISLGYYMNNSNKYIKPVEQVLPSKISLQTSNGENIFLDESLDNIIDLQEDGIVKKELKTISYNEINKVNTLKFKVTLEVPYGKRFNVQLSDGTLVYLNSGSSLKFPVNFLKMW